MSQLLNTTNFSDLVSNLTIKFRKAYDTFPKRVGALYEIEGTDVVTGDESSIDGFSMAKIKREGEDFAYLDINQGYRKAWTIYEVGGMTKITWKMRMGNKYRDIDQRISGLGQSAAKRMEVDMTHRFTFGWDTSYTNYDGDSIATTVDDGYQLFYTAHTVTGSSTTFRNTVANNPQLSKGGLEAAEKLFATQMIDSNGELVFPEADTLVITNNPTLVNTAMEYLNSVADVEAANSGVTNVYKGKYRLLVLPYLATTAAGVADSTKENMWMIADTKRKEALCKVLEYPTFIPPTENDGKEFETQDWKFASHAAFALMILRPTWIVGSKGDGSA